MQIFAQKTHSGSGNFESYQTFESEKLEISNTGKIGYECSYHLHY